jgi:Rod binding domain-containing protein
MPIDAVASMGSEMNIASSVRTPKDAAKAFESMMLKQLMKSMTDTVQESGVFGGGFEGELYSDMFSSAIAEQAAGSGTGLSEMIMRSMGVDERTKDNLLSIGKTAIHALSSYRAQVTGETEIPQNQHLAGVVDQWLGQSNPTNWGTEGALTDADLGANISTMGKGGVAHFNVQDALGYQGYPKCNLFAFEMLRRSGYSVPVLAREHGWGYPGADGIAKLSSDGKIDSWGTVRTGDTKEALEAAAAGGKPLLLASSAPDDKAGHMAVADRIHRVERNGAGNIAVIEYSGWEAGGKKASYGRRVWRLSGIDGQGRGGLDRIEVIEPKSAVTVGEFQAQGARLPGASVADN